MRRTGLASAGRRRTPPVLSILLLFVMTLTVYVPAMQGGFIWDDDDNVTEDTTLRTGHGLARIWFDHRSTQQYYPLTHSNFWLQYQIGGLRPFPYHLANVLLHALGAVLLWLVLKRLSVPGAWLAAAVFAVHPVHVESVAWVTERKNVLSGVFFLGAILAYIRYAGSIAIRLALQPSRPASPRRDASTAPLCCSRSARSRPRRRPRRFPRCS